MRPNAKRVLEQREQTVQFCVGCCDLPSPLRVRGLREMKLSRAVGKKKKKGKKKEEQESQKH